MGMGIYVLLTSIFTTVSELSIYNILVLPEYRSLKKRWSEYRWSEYLKEFSKAAIGGYVINAIMYFIAFLFAENKILPFLLFPGAWILACVITLMYSITLNRIGENYIFRILYKRNAFKQSLKAIQTLFEQRTNTYTICKKERIKTVRYAEISVDADTFMNFIVSGLATAYCITKNGILTEEPEYPQNLEPCFYDHYKACWAMIGICETKSVGLIFYPKTAKDAEIISVKLQTIFSQERRLKNIQKDISKIKEQQQKQLMDNAQRRKLIAENQQLFDQFLDDFFETPKTELKGTNMNKTDIVKPHLEL